MPTNFNDSTPAPPSGHNNVAWQKDGTGNVSANIPTATIATLGLVRPDNATIVIASGVLSAVSTAANFADDETPSGLVNTSNVTFTLAHTPNPSASLLFFINGIQQIVGTDFTLSTATITMSSAPSTGAILRAFYRY